MPCSGRFGGFHSLECREVQAGVAGIWHSACLLLGVGLRVMLLGLVSNAGLNPAPLWLRFSFYAREAGKRAQVHGVPCP